MDEKEKALYDKIQAQIEKATSDTAKGLMTKEAFDTQIGEINEKLSKLPDDFAAKNFGNELQTQIDKLNEKYDAMQLTEKQAEGFADHLIKSMPKMIEMYKDRGKATSDFTMKSGPETMSVINTTGDGVVLEDRMPGINYAPERQPALLQVIRTSTTNSDTVTWVEKTDEQGEPAFKKELETYPQRSWKTIKRSALVKAIAVFAEYTREAMEDVDGFVAEVRRDLVEQIRLVLDANILNGTGGGSADADHKGILEIAQAWDNDGFGLAKANIYDVLAVAINQVQIEHHQPTGIMMHPSLAMAMKLTKDDNGNYVIPPFSAANGVRVDGLPVITNTLFDKKEILVMDSNKADYKIKRDWQLLMSDSHAENFTKGVITVTLTGRGALVIKNVDYKAFVHVSDYKTAITALTSAS